MKKILGKVFVIIIALGTSTEAKALSCSWENKQFVIYQPDQAVESVCLGEALTYQTSPDEKKLCLQRNSYELSFWKNVKGQWRNTQSISVKSIIESYHFSERALYVKTSSHALLIYEKDICGYYNTVPSIALVDVLKYSLSDDEETIRVEHRTLPGVTTTHKNMGNFWLKIS